MPKENKVKSEIITAARGLIYEQGYLETSITDIMRNADVGKGQLYYYFDTKKEIGMDVLEQLDQEWRADLIGEILAPQRPATESIKLMFEWLLDFHQEQDHYYGCPIGNVIIEMSNKDEDYRLLLKNLIETWESALDAKLIQLEIRDTDISAEYIISTLQGAIMLTKLDETNRPLERAISKLSTQLNIV